MAGNLGSFLHPKVCGVYKTNFFSKAVGQNVHFVDADSWHSRNEGSVKTLCNTWVNKKNWSSMERIIFDSIDNLAPPHLLQCKPTFSWKDAAKKKVQITELQVFVSRFSANASKAKQATSRARQIDKIQLAEVKPSSRVSPYIRFNQDKRLYRLALEATGLSKAYTGKPLFKNLDLQVEVGERVAIIGASGTGKTTLLRTLVGELEADCGTRRWSENANIGYFAQDHSADFAQDMDLYSWMAQWGKPEDDEQVLRGTLGRLLFAQHEINKSVKVISGGEQGRMLFGKLMLQMPNIMLLDEPTNHLDMESIEALNLALDNYPGTLFFVSHDREFISSLATRIIDVSAAGVVDFNGSYDEYLRSQGIEEFARQRAAS